MISNIMMCTTAVTHPRKQIHTKTHTNTGDDYAAYQFAGFWFFFGFFFREGNNKARTIIKPLEIKLSGSGTLTLSHLLFFLSLTLSIIHTLFFFVSSFCDVMQFTFTNLSKCQTQLKLSFNS